MFQAKYESSRSSVFAAGPSELYYQRRVGGLVLEYIRYPTGKVLPRHHHSVPGAYVHLAGECREVWRQRQQTLRQGDSVFRPEDDIHSNSYCLPTKIIGIGLVDERVDEYRNDFRFDVPRAARSASLLLLAGKIANNISSVDAASILTLEGAALEILGELFRKPATKCSPAIARVENLLKETFRNPLSLCVLANEVGVHPAHLAREFRRIHKITIGEYVRKLRIEYVCNRLRTSQDSICDLAHEAGFADHAHLCHMFKALIGVSPATFRAQTRDRRHS